MLSNAPSLSSFLRLADAEAEHAGIDEFFILRLVVAVLVRAVARHKRRHMALVVAAGNEHPRVRLKRRLRRVDLLFFGVSL